jgi:hypothetical protein
MESGKKPGKIFNGFLVSLQLYVRWRMLLFAGIVFRDKGFGWSGFGLDYGFQCFQESVQAYLGKGVLFVRLGQEISRNH